jgi:hypothetical protein
MHHSDLTGFFKLETGTVLSERIDRVIDEFLRIFGDDCLINELLILC